MDKPHLLCNCGLLDPCDPADPGERVVFPDFGELADPPTDVAIDHSLAVVLLILGQAEAA